MNVWLHLHLAGNQKKQIQTQGTDRLLEQYQTVHTFGKSLQFSSDQSHLLGYRHVGLFWRNFDDVDDLAYDLYDPVYGLYEKEKGVYAKEKIYGLTYGMVEGVMIYGVIEVVIQTPGPWVRLDSEERVSLLT